MKGMKITSTVQWSKSSGPKNKKKNSSDCITKSVTNGPILPLTSLASKKFFNKKIRQLRQESLLLKAKKGAKKT